MSDLSVPVVVSIEDFIQAIDGPRMVLTIVDRGSHKQMVVEPSEKVIDLARKHGVTTNVGLRVAGFDFSIPTQDANHLIGTSGDTKTEKAYGTLAEALEAIAEKGRADAQATAQANHVSDLRDMIEDTASVYTPPGE